MGPGPHGDMGPGPHGDMGPGPHGDIITSAVNACFENQGSPDKCCSLIGDEQGEEMCMNGEKIHQCFENEGSPDECCSLMGDQHEKEMCLKHSQDGPGPHGDMGPGPHGDMGPGPHGDMGPGPHGDMGPGPHGDMGPGPHGDMGPGPHGDIITSAVDACFENQGSPDECCSLMGDEQGKAMCMNGEKVHQCFENDGSPDECCSLMGDQHEKEMCLKHSQDDPGPHGNMGPGHMMCDPARDYPPEDPGANGCGNYADCNGNGAYDRGEPCAEHD